MEKPTNEWTKGHRKVTIQKLLIGYQKLSDHREKRGSRNKIHKTSPPLVLCIHEFAMQTWPNSCNTLYLGSPEQLLADEEDEEEVELVVEPPPEDQVEPVDEQPGEPRELSLYIIGTFMK